MTEPLASSPTTPGAAAADGPTPPPWAAPAPAPEWPVWRRVLFRFGGTYLVLYNLPFPLGAIPFTEPTVEPYESTVNWAAGWLGANVLGFEKAPESFLTGSGDTPLQFCRAALFAAAALVLTIAWSLLARSRRTHPRLHALVRIHVRYALAATLLGYGFAKVFKSQFQMPEGEQLFTPLGQKSPMGLLWTFVGFSTVYTMFVGAALRIELKKLEPESFFLFGRGFRWMQDFPVNR